MKLSVIIAAYNAADTIRNCLDYVLAQEVRDFEVIVIDDGSQDATPAILEEYAERYPNRLLWRTVENGGQGRARNIGMTLATGDYIGYVDSDDWIEPTMFEEMIRTAEKTGAEIVLCDVVAHYPDGHTEAERIWRPERTVAAAGFASNKLFRRNLLKEIRFPEEKLWYEDTEFTAIALHRANRIEHLPKALYHYRRGETSTMNNNNARKNLDILTVMSDLEEEFRPEESEQGKDDFEFLAINHVLLDAMNRVQAMDDPEKGDVLWLMRAWVHEKLPRLGACRSFREETKNRQLIMRLHYMGLSGVAGKLLELNAKNRREK